MRRFKIPEQDIINAVNNSRSMAEAASKLPINFKTFRNYCKILGIYTTKNPGTTGLKLPSRSIPLDAILSNKHIGYHSYKLKQRLHKELGWEYKCHICFLTEWQHQQIPLELDHIDGNHFNNSLTNLRFICPNCHAQTPTYRNKKRK